MPLELLNCHSAPPVPGSPMAERQSCISCRFLLQGPGVCFCGHPDASPKARSYVTYFFWCRGWQDGESPEATPDDLLLHEVADLTVQVEHLQELMG